MTLEGNLWPSHPHPYTTHRNPPASTHTLTTPCICFSNLFPKPFFASCLRTCLSNVSHGGGDSRLFRSLAHVKTQAQCDQPSWPPSRRCFLNGFIKAYLADDVLHTCKGQNTQKQGVFNALHTHVTTSTVKMNTAGPPRKQSCFLLLWISLHGLQSYIVASTRTYSLYIT